MKKPPVLSVIINVRLLSLLLLLLLLLLLFSLLLLLPLLLLNNNTDGRYLSVVILPTLVYQRKCLVSTLKQLHKCKHSVNLVFVQFWKCHEMRKLELCITVPTKKMLNLIWSLNLLEFTKLLTFQYKRSTTSSIQ